MRRGTSYSQAMSGPDNRESARLVEVDPDVIFRRVDNELVLVKIATNEIFALNPTGARIWELLGEGADIDHTVQRLVEEYDAPKETVRLEVEVFVTELQRQGFLR